MEGSGFPLLRRVATAANFVTAMRLFAAPLLALAIHAGLPRPAAVLFAVGVATDFLDGWASRRLGEVSPGGRTFDHATDAIFVAAGLAALASRGALPVWLAPLVMLAFLQYALDSGGFSGRFLRASSLGRANGIAYYVLLGIPVVRDALGLSWPPAVLVRALGWLLVATTLVSMAERLRALWRSLH
jgi:cardiolipin synthase